MRLSGLIRALTDVARALTSSKPRSNSGSGTNSGSGRSRPVSTSRGTGARSTQASPSSVAPDRSTQSSPHAAGGSGVSEYDHDRLGVPTLVYRPDQDGDPDPGEVVWGWVPYEEDATQGKDRPLLIVGTSGGSFVAVQLTSKNRAADGRVREDDGRVWFDVGTGAWDRQRRPSEARLDRLLLVQAPAIRREGAALPRERFDEVVAVLRGLHGW